MSCQEFLVTHTDYVDELLSPADTARMHAHALECRRCGRYDQVMRRGLELARALPSIEPSCDFQHRLQHRLLHVRDALGPDGTAAGGTAAVSVALAGLLALAAWGPLLRGDDETAAVTAGTVVEQPASSIAAEQVPIDEFDWWGPASFVSPPRPLSGAFPGPYSPLVVMPPTADYQAGLVRAVLSSYSGLE
jgi:hypothetical protein